MHFHYNTTPCLTEKWGLNVSKNGNIWSYILYSFWFFRMMAGSKSSFTLLEELSLACSWYFYVITYILKLHCSNYFRIYWDACILLSLWSILFARVYNIVYSIIPTFVFFILILCLLLSSFNLFIFYFKLCCNAPARHQPPGAGFFRCSVWHCHFERKIKFCWDFSKKRYTVGWDTAAAAAKEIMGEQKLGIRRGRLHLTNLRRWQMKTWRFMSL